MLGQKVKYLSQMSMLLAMVLTLNVAVADTTAAQQFFESGNAAFRQGNFESALESYIDAITYGKDTPRLHYNMGLAHARLDQNGQARASFELSSNDRILAGLSYYQLGALAHKLGNTDEAVMLLTRARDNANSDKLRRQSTRALEKIGVRRSEFESSLSAGYGYDSNAYQSPDKPYIDNSISPPTPVVPMPQSGPFVPIRAKGRYWRPVSSKSAFVTSYSFRGEYHTDPELQNADYYDHRLKIGGERNIGKSRSRHRRVGVEAYYRLHGETNFDRDDGLDRFDDGQSIADRYDYRGIGTAADLRYRIGPSRMELQGGWEQRDYDDTNTASSYDMTNTWIGADIKFDTSKNTRLKFGYRYYVRDFDERRSRDLSGDASLSNPTIEYQYNHLTAGYKHRFNKRFLAEIEYGYTVRTDEFVGYNDYRRHRIRLASSIAMTDQLRSIIRLDFRDQSYPNAFAFDEPGQLAKEYQEIEATLVVNYELTDQLTLTADIRQEIVESSDPRGEFDRLKSALRMNWQFD